MRSNRNYCRAISELILNHIECLETSVVDNISLSYKYANVVDYHACMYISQWYKYGNVGRRMYVSQSYKYGNVVDHLRYVHVLYVDLLHT